MIGEVNGDGSANSESCRATNEQAAITVRAIGMLRAGVSAFDLLRPSVIMSCQCLVHGAGQIRAGDCLDSPRKLA